MIDFSDEQLPSAIAPSAIADEVIRRASLRAPARLLFLREFASIHLRLRAKLRENTSAWDCQPPPHESGSNQNVSAF
jgi:hypothetical protein